MARAGAPCSGHPPPRPVTCGVLVSQGVPRENCPPYRCVPDRPRGRRRRRRRGGRGRAGPPLVPPDLGRAGRARAARRRWTCCATSRACRRSTPTTPRTCSAPRATSPPRTGSSRWTCAGTSPPGRLSEMVGAGGLETDKVIRTMGWRRVAEAELPHAGARRPGSTSRPTPTGSTPTSTQHGLPVQDGARVRRAGPAGAGLPGRAWTPVDSLAWLKAMAWDLRGNYDNELARARLAGTLSRSARSPSSSRPTPTTRTSRSCPRRTGSRAASAARPARPRRRRPPCRTTCASKDVRAVYAEVSRSLAAVPVMLGRGDGIGSNSWVVSGSRTSTASRCWPTTRTSAPASPASGTRSGCTAARSAPSARSTSPASPSPACPASSSATTSGSPGASPTSARTSATSTSSRSAATTYLRDGQLRPAARARTETIKVGRRQGRARSRSADRARPDPVRRGAPTWPGPATPRRSRASAHGGRYDVSLAWTGLRPGARPTRSSRSTRPRTSRSSGRRRATSRCRRRTSSTPTRRATSATRRPGRSRSGPSSTPERPPGYWPAPGWKSRVRLEGLRPLRRRCRTTYDPPEGFIVAANQAVSASTDAVPHHRVGLRLPQPAHPRPARGDAQGDARADVADPDGQPQRVRPDAGQGAAADQDRPLHPGRPEPAAHWDFTEPTGQSDQAAAAAYYNAVWSKLLRPHLQRRADR